MVRNRQRTLARKVTRHAWKVQGSEIIPIVRAPRMRTGMVPFYMGRDPKLCEVHGLPITRGGNTCVRCRK